MENKANITNYPKVIDDYFIKNEITIKTMRDDFRVIEEKHLPNKKIKSAKQFIAYVQKEKDFWFYGNIEKNHIVSNYPDAINQSITNFNSAVLEANKAETIIDLSQKTQVLNTATSLLTNSVITFCNTCKIASNSNLAKLFKEKNTKDSYYFFGFETAILNRSGQNNYYAYNAWYEGYNDGLQYKKTISAIQDVVDSSIDNLKTTSELVSTQFSDLIAKSTNDYHNQEARIKKLWDDNETELATQKQEMSTFVKKERENLQKLEETYQAKLRLSKPAEYWNKMESKYRHSGITWLSLSCVIALLTIATLIIIIIYIPNLYDTNEHWFETMRNTALLTVITSIAIYILRITIKLAMSSYHLSRDAKEREQLTYFYLSLINENAVTDKERDLIITSLFSRSDTGLLKGDSSPSMPNITDIITKDSKK